MATLESDLRELASAAREASRSLAVASSDTKNGALRNLAVLLDRERAGLAEANGLDVEAARSNGLSGAMLDRLTLTPARIDAMIRGVREVAALADPVGELLKEWTLPNGLRMSKVRVPIGVIGIIYESRPNVTVDASILCLKTGNVTILRGGSEAFESNRFLAGLIARACREAGLPGECVTLVPTRDRAAIPILCGLSNEIDLMIPRGGHGLIETVVSHARMPVIKHYHGVCHVYVHPPADLERAIEIILNAKCQRPGVCNAMETLLLHRDLPGEWVRRLFGELRNRKVKILGDGATSSLAGETLPEPENWTTEYLDLVLAVRTVGGLDEAIGHINRFGSHHSDSILTMDEAAAERFTMEVDSAAVYTNASTRFTDGGEFGFGAEIGISTDKIHARGPMALEELTSYKYIGRGTGQIRS
jgi:glutamate-5-semialdehyde dehydrogenase